MTELRTDIIPGTVIVVRYGPFQATATVMEVSPIGIVIAPNDDAKLVGYEDTLTAPNGARLTSNRFNDFIGAAHLAAVTVVEDNEIRSNKLRTIQRCDANARKGTGTGLCDAPLDQYGQCPNASRHVG